MQPLDYTFQIVILVIALYKAQSVWRSHFKTNETFLTSDDIVERYCKLVSKKDHK